VNTYGFHTIHGRAPAIATGIKAYRPDLSVWVVTGDGDGLSIGGNHLLHALRRNVDMKILLFNNRIYGLTKGQYSPTSELGKKTKSSPMGTVDYPLNPISFALGAEGTFIARTIDSDTQHLAQTLLRAGQHKGTSLIEIFQNCVIFNDEAFHEVTEREIRPEHMLVLEQGKPLIFGKNRDKGIRLNGSNLEVVSFTPGDEPKDLVVHDETNPNPAYAFLLSRMELPQFPVPVGVFRAVQKTPYETLLEEQIKASEKALGRGELKALLNAGETWTVT